MIVKDLRLFRRDPLQWSQFLVFLGLLVLYFLNIRRFTYDVSSIAWVNMVSFLNLAVVGLLLSTFTTRFIYPMISLEGRRFWILGLLGVRRETILWSKFLFAVLGSAIPCSALVLMSDVMLGVSSLVVASHQLTCVVLCLGLAGIAVGLGAWLPNLREESPVADRRRLRRNAEPGRQHAVYPGRGAADGPADPLSIWSRNMPPSPASWDPRRTSTGG